MVITTERYPDFTDNSVTVMKRRYLVKDPETKVPTEEPDDMFLRVGDDLAEGDRPYGATDEEIAETSRAFYGIMRRLEFMPNSPTLMNAGRDLQQLSACFVLPIEDSLDSIFTRVKQTALIHQSGGGTGFAFTRLRPEGDVVKSTGGVASGPATFIRVYDVATDVVKQGGTRRGANMAILSVYHPDVEKFIIAKRDGHSLGNFNISIGIDRAFMEKADRGESFETVNPRTGKAMGRHDARAIFDLIAQCAWETGDPGLVFLDRINADNPNPQLGEIESTNPCVAGDAVVATTEGPRTAAELEGRPFVALVNGHQWPSEPRGFFHSGTRRTVELATAGGHQVRVTPDHRVRRRTTTGDEWTEARNVQVGDMLVLNRTGAPDGEKSRRAEAMASMRHGGDVRTINRELTATSDNPCDRVTSTTQGPVEDVFDVQIPGINAFDANGLYVHQCGEQPLLPWESCNLGSINLRRMLTEGEKPVFDIEKIKRVCRTAVHMLDNVIERNAYPVDEIGDMTRATRRIGVGVMGWADALIAMGIRYDSEEAVELAGRIMQEVRRCVDEASMELAVERGPFPEWENSIYAKDDRKMRNSAPTTIAPTGTISTIAGTSSGIEPLFALAYTRRVLDGDTLVELNQDLMQMAERDGFMSDALMKSLTATGTIGDDVAVPDEVRETFRTSQQIEPIWHVRMQAAFQEWTENAVSKTVNLPHEATTEDVAATYRAAWDLGCKGITIYRDGSKDEQVLATGRTDEALAAGKLSPRPRPASLTGETFRVRTGHGNAYITINKDERDEMFEVFAVIGKAGSCDSVTMQAVTRLISLALRTGVDPEEVIEQLRGNACCPFYDDGVLVQSSADAVAIAMQKAMGVDIHTVTPEQAQMQIATPGMVRGRLRCPDCNGMVIMQGNCPTCPECSWSQC